MKNDIIKNPIVIELRYRFGVRVMIKIISATQTLTKKIRKKYII